MNEKFTHFCMASCVSFSSSFSLLLPSTFSPLTAACFSSLPLLVLLVWWLPLDLLPVFVVVVTVTEVTSSRLLRRPWDGSCVVFGDFGDFGDLGDLERWCRLPWCLLIFSGIAENVDGEIGAFTETGVVESASNGFPYCKIRKGT